MSRTDHPRQPGTHRAWTRHDRHDEEEGYSERIAVKRLTWHGSGSTDVEAINEGLDDHTYVEFAYGPECEWDALMVPVVDRLAVVAAEVDGDAPAEQVWDWSLDDEDAYFGEDEDIHYGDPAERVDVYVDDDGEEYHAGPIEDLDADTDWTPWLPLMTYDEACEELAYGFTVEGPSIQPEPLREGHYVRVYQLARDLGVDSKPLVGYLRGAGEYVLGHQSWVALPVADRLVADKDAIALELGGRITPDTGAQKWQEALVWEARRYAARVVRPSPAPRPGAPRPGNNPFAGRY